LLGWFLERRRRERSAQRYANELPRQLARDFGASETYSAVQIRRAAERAKLPLEHLAIGYAAFLSVDAFAAVVGAERANDYERLREVFIQRLDVGLRSGWGTAEDSVSISGLDVTAPPTSD
jgi:hypothetical protein